MASRDRGGASRSLPRREPECSRLEQILADAWEFHRAHPGGYGAPRAEGARAGEASGTGA